MSDLNFTLLAIVWIVGWIAASIFYRRVSGKPILPRVPNDAKFSETWRSGRSLKNLLTRIGGARNCLLVYVSGGTLTVMPMFPFNLMFLPEIYGLEITAPTSLVKISEGSGLLGDRILVTVDGREDQRIELSIRDRQGLQRALQGG